MPVVTSSTGNDRATPGPLSQVSGYADTVVNLGVGGAVITASAFLLLVSVFSRASRTLDNSNVLPRSKQKATWILDVLKQQQLVTAQVSVLRAEPGVGFAFESGSRHAELEILEDNQAYLSLYDLDGPIVVETPLVRRAADAAPTVSRIHEYLAH